ncbi:hypothetical protein [Nonomuraea rubra]|uniref:hypothetical protein n=1 Tax=Nonomuraea rubra TaxID=46180 RepID=UPI0031ECBB94
MVLGRARSAILVPCPGRASCSPPRRTGKTTVVRRLADLLRADARADLRFLHRRGTRARPPGGFTVADFAGHQAVMAHLSWVTGPRVAGTA